MKTDNDSALAERFVTLADKVDDGDWNDVLRRRDAAAAEARRKRVRPARIVALVCAFAIAAVVVLVAPWSRSNGSLSNLALGAIGSQQVLHVIGEVPMTGLQSLDITTGARLPNSSWREETWYDEERGLEHTITRSGGVVVDDLLLTPQGGYTPGGIVYDCTWIAAHPVAATKSRVSCNVSGKNGTRPRVVPRAKPVLNPGLSGFLDGYRQALRDGTARAAGTGRLDGRPVEWLSFTTDGGRERVALDAVTHKPVLVEDASGWSMRIDTIETVGTDAANFSRPTRLELPVEPVLGRAFDDTVVQRDGASIATAVPGALWVGEALSGLPLGAVTRESLRATFARGGPPAEMGVGVQLDYGTLESNGRLDRAHPFVQIWEAPSRTLAFAYMWGFTHGANPSAGQMYIQSSGGGTSAIGPNGKALPPSPPLWLGFAILHGRYVTIQASSSALALAAAQALRPASS